jgi:hypothetical protein
LAFVTQFNAEAYPEDMAKFSELSYHPSAKADGKEYRFYQQ